MTLIAVTYGYARVSKADDESKNLDTQPPLLAQHGVRYDLVYSDVASERIRLGLDRARASGKRVGRPPALSDEQVEQCRRMGGEGAGLRQIARVMGCSPATEKRVQAGAGE